MVKGKYSVIDAHCHIYPEAIAQRAVAGTDGFYSLHSVYKGTVNDLLEKGTLAGVDRFVVQSVATAPKQVKSINEFIASEVNAHPEKLTGLGTLHPESVDIKGDIEHLKELGLKGVKLHPDIQKFKIDDYRCLKIYELCEKMNLPILMHTGDSRYDYSNPNRMLPILEIYTNLTVIGAHLGGWSVWDDAAEKLAHHDNFYVDTCSCFPFMEKEKALQIIRHYGADRVLFGTDYPMWNFEKEIETVLSLGLDESEIMSILNINAKKLFCLE